MKLIFDCTALSRWKGRYTGIQRVVYEIGTKLGAHIPNCELGILDPSSHKWLRYVPDQGNTQETLVVSAGDLIFTVGENWDYPDHSAGLMINVANGLHLGVLFYDTIPMSHPHSYGPGFAEKYKTWLDEALTATDCALAISQSTANDIVAYSASHGIDIPPVHTLRLGDDLLSSDNAPSEKILTKTQDPYVLTVGTIEFRKNHNTLLNTWRYMINDLGKTPPNLFLVGRTGWLNNDISYQLANDPVLKERVEILEDISDADLQHLYKNTLFTVYPSIYEGWGLPIAESLGYGKVCIASNTSSMTEIAPGLTRHAHPLLITEWVDHICELAENPEVLAAEESRIISEYQSGTWDESARQLAKGLIKQYPNLGQRSQ